MATCLTRGERAARRLFEVLGYLPSPMAREIREIARSVFEFEYRLSEVRVRAGGPSSLTVGGVDYPLFYRVSPSEVAEILSAITDGAAYAHRSSVARGYVTAGSVRVGVSGHARYDGEEVGIGEISSLVFRLAGGECSFGEQLFLEWRERGGPNMLVAAPPMGGKTTALRALASYIGRGRDALRVAVVDERCEFDREDYYDASVDVLCGYRRADGIELAYRTMSAEVIIADEIASREEASALLAAHGAGVRLISSTHARDADGVRSRECVLPLLEAGVFRLAAIISSDGRSFGYEMVEL